MSQGTVYNLPPVGAEPARLGIKVRPAAIGPVVIEKISLIAVAKLGPETGYALETTIPNQPRTVNSTIGPVALEVTRVDLTLRGKPGAKDFMINPSSCAPGTATTRAVPYDSGSPSSRSAPYTATNCPGLAFGPLVSGTIGARRANRAGQNVALTSVIDFPLGNASLRDTVVLLPTDVGSDVNSIGRACPVATPIAACPVSSHIGSAEAASLLLDTPLKGPLVLKASATSALPSLVVDLKGAAPLTLFGTPDFVGNRVRNTFPGAPDVPLSRFTLRVDGGKGGLLLAAQDLCRPDKKQVLDAKLTGWNGKVVTRKVALKPQGCKGYRPPKPKATVALRRGAGRMSVKVTAGDYTRLRSLRVTLPKGVDGQPRAPGGADRRQAARARSACEPWPCPAREAVAPRRQGPETVGARGEGRSPAGGPEGARPVRRQGQHRPHRAPHRQDARAALGKRLTPLTRSIPRSSPAVGDAPPVPCALRSLIAAGGSPPHHFGSPRASAAALWPFGRSPSRDRPRSRYGRRSSSPSTGRA